MKGVYKLIKRKENTFFAAQPLSHKAKRKTQLSNYRHPLFSTAMSRAYSVPDQHFIKNKSIDKTQKICRKIKLPEIIFSGLLRIYVARFLHRYSCKSAS